MAAAGRVVLVEQAVADSHGGMGIGVAVDVEDEDVAGFAAVVALARLVPAFVEECVVQLGHPAEIVAVVAGVAREAGEGTTSVSSHGSKLRATVVGVATTVTVGPIHGGSGVVTAGSGAGTAAQAALDVGRASAVARLRVATTSRAFTSGHALATAGGSVAVVVGAAFNIG